MGENILYLTYFSGVFNTENIVTDLLLSSLWLKQKLGVKIKCEVIRVQVMK